MAMAEVSFPSIDRLAAIILNEFFPYYEFWSATPKSEPCELVRLNHHAHRLWEEACILPGTSPACFNVTELR